jgi:hypothetical protein
MTAPKILMTVLLLFFLITGTQAQVKPLSANEVITQAKAEAVKAHKNIFIIFHASWCGWCRKMDASMNDHSIKQFFDQTYVIKHLTVDESPEKKNLENPGAAELRTKYKGDKQGIPYWFILDANGKLLADSRLHSDDGKVTGNNVGCPARPDEVNYFISVIKRTSNLNDMQLALIQERFSKNGE